MSEELAERLNNWAMDAFEGRSLIGAVQDISEGARVVSDAARIERNRDMWKGQCERQATELTTLRAENELMREVVSDLLPRGVCWDNPNIPDNTVIPVDMTMGEIRKARNALAQVAK